MFGRRPARGMASPSAVLVVLLVFLGAMIVIGVVIWLRMAPQGQPSQPNQAGHGHSELRYQYRVPGTQYQYPQRVVSQNASCRNASSPAPRRRLNWYA